MLIALFDRARLYLPITAAPADDEPGDGWGRLLG